MSGRTTLKNLSTSSENKKDKEKEVLEKNYELIITEKPQAALKIASFLGKMVKKQIFSVPYYEVDRNGKRIVVACAAGHLFTLNKKNKKKDFPVFELKWVPNYFVKKDHFSKKYYDVISHLIKGSESITIATDYDVEGEVIGMNIVRFIAGRADASRMKFSTLTKEEINYSYEKKSENLNWGQAIAGETRHYLDWIYGINLSKLLMDTLSITGKFRIMSIGRVQGPTLKIIVDKERKIKEFKPQKYWQIFLTLKDPETNSEIELKYIEDIFDEKNIPSLKDIIGKKYFVKSERTSRQVPPLPPFNLTSLQTEGYRLLGFTPSKTLQVAQSLYLKGVISYPRTSSQKLPPSIDYEKILKKLSKRYGFEELTIKKTPIEGKKTDPAHPAIFPTGVFSELSKDELSLYDLIVRRFLSLFCESSIIDTTKIAVELDGLEFFNKGSSIREKKWMNIYPFDIEEKKIPFLNKECEVINFRIEEKETNPPKRYSQASLISELEKKNLGTKSTRAAIIETLYSREYIKGKNIEPTPLGISLISILEKYSPIIIDENLTREFEEDMKIILESKKNFEEKEKRVIEKAKRVITKIVKNFSENKEKIAEELLSSSDTLLSQKKEENKLDILCPLCRKGNLIISYSKKTRKNFIACSNYPDCKNTYTLPKKGLIKKSEEFCKECGFQKIILLKRNKRPWVFCFNRECSTRKNNSNQKLN